MWVYQAQCLLILVHTAFVKIDQLVAAGFACWLSAANVVVTQTILPDVYADLELLAIDISIVTLY